MVFPLFRDDVINKYLLHDRVEPRSRFIQNQNIRVVHKGSHHRQFSLNAETHFLRPDIRVQFKFIQQHFAVVIIFDSAHFFHHMQKLRACNACRKRNFSRQIAYHFLQSGCLFPTVLSQDTGRSALRSGKSHQMPYGRCFPRTVGTQKAETLTLFHMCRYYYWNTFHQPRYCHVNTIQQFYVVLLHFFFVV